MKADIVNDSHSPPKISAAAVLACAWPALLLATVCLVPFLNKPFLNDDPFFLTQARQIVQHPLHPMDFTICYDSGLGCAKAYAQTPGDALMGYVLVPTILTGAHEWTAHLTQLVFVWIAIVAMTSLIFRFGWDRWHATAGALLLVAIAPFMPMASTVMPDILGTTLAILAMERLAAWKAEQKWRQCAYAAIALGLAGFARPHLALLLPLAAFYLLDSADPREVMAQFRRRFWMWTPVLAGGGLLLAVIAITRENNLAINPPASVRGIQYIARNLRTYLVYFAFPFPLAACWLASRLKARLWRAPVILAAATALIGILHPDHPLFSFLALVGLGMGLDLLFVGLDKKDHNDLFLLLWILIPLPIVYYITFSSKYCLPCIPAVILLCFRRMKPFPIRFSRAAAIAVIAASTVYSVLILRSDDEFARFGRDAMYALIQPHVAAGEKVWYGTESCSYWYAPLAGATKVLPDGPQPMPGDFLVLDRLEGGYPDWIHISHRTLVATITHKYRFGRTMGAGVGLYNNGSGFWMWGFGVDKNDRFELWRID
jgi:uncharacterized membrane protein YhaH (DUF805 family)